MSLSFHGVTTYYNYCWNFTGEDAFDSESDGAWVIAFDGCNTIGAQVTFTDTGFALMESPSSSEIYCPNATPLLGFLEGGGEFVVSLGTNDGETTMRLTGSDGRSLDAVHFDSTSINN